MKPGVTKTILWEEYRDACLLNSKRPYSQTQFNDYFREFLDRPVFSDILSRKAGEQIQVDWAGDRPYWTDPDTGEIVYGYLFGGILPFSGLAFARITTDMKMANWIDCHIRMFEYFGGTAKILVSDNLKTGVIKHTKNELVLNPGYEDLANHYGMIIVPGRVRKPKDKPQVEALMNQFERAIIGRLRDCQFFSIEEYNEAAMKEVERFNNKPFQKKEGSRRIIFEEYEKDTLQPLPDKPYELSTWKKAKVQKNSHIAYGKNYYSVPYHYIGKEVDLKITSKKIIVYFDKQELAEHELILNHIGVYSTVTDHMPMHSNAYGEWNSARYLNWAKTKGPHVYQVIFQLFQSTKVEQRYYNVAHSILKLADKYSDERLESACRYALSLLKRPLYRDIKHILKSNDDLRQENENKSSTFLRGGDYFD